MSAITGARPRIFVVEDHPIVRRGIAALVEERYDLVGSADEATVAISMILERRPDLVLCDVNLPGGGGAAVVESVRRQAAGIRFLALTVSTSRSDVARLFRAGIDGYVVKTSEERDLIAAIDQVLTGGRPVSPEVAGYLLDIDEQVVEVSGIERLTDQERRVTRLVARGFTYREAAMELGISVKTLEKHIGHIFEKVGVATRHQLTRLAYDTGFLAPDSAHGAG